METNWWSIEANGSKHQEDGVEYASIVAQKHYQVHWNSGICSSIE